MKTYKGGHVNKKYSLTSALLYTRAGAYVVTPSEDKKICLYDLQKRSVVQVLEGHTDIPLCVDCYSGNPSYDTYIFVVVVVATAALICILFYFRILLGNGRRRPSDSPMIASGALEDDTSVRIWQQPHPHHHQRQEDDGDYVIKD